MCSFRPNGIGALVLAALLLAHGPELAAQGADADGYRLNLELGLLRTDNPLANSPRGPGDTLLVPRAEFDLHRLGQHWQARASGYTEYRFALENVADDEFRANLVAALDWSLLPGSLNWALHNVASVEPIDFQASDSARNLQQTNVFSTGPTWQIRPKAVWSGVLDARYTHAYAEQNDEFNSDRVSFSGRLLHRFDATRQMSIGAEVTEVSYRDVVTDDADYRRLDLVARYHARAPRGDWEVAAGHTRIKPDQGSSLSAPLFRFRLLWAYDEQQEFRLLALHEFSDSTRQLGREIDQIGALFTATSRLPIGAELYRLSSIEPSWHYRYARGDLTVRPFYRGFDFEFAPEADFRELGVDLVGSWRFRPLTTVSASLGVDRRRFQSEQRRDTDLRASLFLVRRFAPRWSGRIGLVRYQRNSNMEAADSREMILAVYLSFHAGR
jgi:hypothetical protein